MNIQALSNEQLKKLHQNRVRVLNHALIGCVLLVMLGLFTLPDNTQWFVKAGAAVSFLMTGGTFWFWVYPVLKELLRRER